MCAPCGNVQNRAWHLHGDGTAVVSVSAAIDLVTHADTGTRTSSSPPAAEPNLSLPHVRAQPQHLTFLSRVFWHSEHSGTSAAPEQPLFLNGGVGEKKPAPSSASLRRGPLPLDS